MKTSSPRLVAAVLAAALALAACSSSDGSSASTTTAPPGTTTAETTTTADRATGKGPTRTGTPVARFADYRSTSYDDPSHWVCRPEADDICQSDLDTTVIAADGSSTVERFEADEKAPIDCFYVYPTISRDETTYSDWDASPEEEGFVTLQQAARLRSVCRVFAPVYRQRTLTSLIGAMSGGAGGTTGPTADPFADVQDAFRTYLAEDNEGRGIVLIGHSQGAGLLNKLIATEIDGHDDVRSLLVGAYLAGGAVAVPTGKAVGGDFQHVPLCTRDAEAGCVTTWATFDNAAPPPADTFFGRVREGDGEAGCVNPAKVDGGDVELHGYFPAERGRSILAPGAEKGPTSWSADGSHPVDTPFVSLPGLVTGSCRATDGIHYLGITVRGEPGDRRVTDIGGRLTPQWGLHLIDVNVVMGDIIDRVRQQTATWSN